MEIRSQIGDKDFERLIKSGRSMKCSVKMLAPDEVVLTVYNTSERKPRKFQRLPHGTVSMGEKDVRFSQTYHLDEDMDLPIDQSIELEAMIASNYVCEKLKGINN